MKKGKLTILITVVAIYLASSTINVATDKLLGFSWDKVYDMFQPKPEVIVNIQSYVETELNHSQNHSILLFLISACNEKVVLYNDIISSPLLGRSDVQVPSSYSNMECRFEDGRNCTYYAFQIKNVGRASAKSFTLDVTTTSSSVETTSIASPKIELSKNFGFINEKGFRMKVTDIDINESLGLLIKLDTGSIINPVCKISDAQSLCFQNVVESRTHVLGEHEQIIGYRNGTPMSVDVSYIPTTYEPVLYEYDSPSGYFVRTDATIDVECKV